MVTEVKKVPVCKILGETCYMYLVQGLAACIVLSIPNLGNRVISYNLKDSPNTTNIPYQPRAVLSEETGPIFYLILRKDDMP